MAHVKDEQINKVEQPEELNKEDTPLEEQFKELLTSLNEQKTQLTNAISKIKQLQKTCAKELKNKKNKKSDPTKKREPSGFTKPIKLSVDLCSFLDKPNGTEMARTEVTKIISIYIKENNLQLEEDKRTILPDKKLSSLLKSSKTDKITYFNLQTWMKPHYIKE